MKTNNKVNVIEASRNDIDRLISINRNVFQSDEEEAFGFVEENFQNPGRNLYSIFYENKIVGMIGVFTETDREYIYGFCTEEKYQGMGIGKQSLTSVGDYAIMKVWLNLQRNNSSSVNTTFRHQTLRLLPSSQAIMASVTIHSPSPDTTT